MYEEGKDLSYEKVCGSFGHKPWFKHSAYIHIIYYKAYSSKLYRLTIQ